MDRINETSQKIYKIVFIYIVVTIVSFFIFFDFLILMLVWNMILANIALVVSNIIRTEINNKKRKILIIILVLIWLIFLPNGFYLVTDFIHLSKESFYIDNNFSFVYVNNYKGYFLLVNIFIATMIGIISSLYSMFIIDNLSNNKVKNFNMKIFLGLVCLLSSIGIYIGRFLRFNSWDLFIRPFMLLKEIIQNLSWFSLYFIILIWFFHIVVYLLFIYLKKK